MKKRIALQRTEIDHLTKPQKEQTWLPSPPQHLLAKMRYFLEHRIGRKQSDGADFGWCDGCGLIPAGQVVSRTKWDHRGRPLGECVSCSVKGRNIPAVIKNHGVGVDCAPDVIVFEDYIAHNSARVIHSIDIELMTSVLFLTYDANQAFREGQWEQPDAQTYFELDDAGAPSMADEEAVTWEKVFAGDPVDPRNPHKTLHGYTPFLKEHELFADAEAGNKPGPPDDTIVGRWHSEFIESPHPVQPIDDGPEENPELIDRGRVKGRVEHPPRGVAREI